MTSMPSVPGRGSVHKAVLLHEVIEQFTRNPFAGGECVGDDPSSEAAGEQDQGNQQIRRREKTASPTLPLASARPIVGKEPTNSPPANVKWYLDCTIGGCGHALVIADAFKGKIGVIGLDQDAQAIERARQMLQGKAEKVILENENFRNLDKALDRHGIKEVGLILFDLGVSSDELENSGKGFSFQKDEPLLMAMGNPALYPFTAKEIVNGWKEEDIANVIFAYGEEKHARRIAKKIVEYRQKKAIETSAELAEIVKMAVPRIPGKARLHPATKTFQALRIAVNDELNALKEGLSKGYARLARGGKMAVISFHSLEDRIIKDFYRKKEREEKAIISKKPLRASAEEIADNPRARSAKMRIIEKI